MSRAEAAEMGTWLGSRRGPCWPGRGIDRGGGAGVGLAADGFCSLAGPARPSSQGWGRGQVGGGVQRDSLPRGSEGVHAGPRLPSPQILQMGPHSPGPAKEPQTSPPPLAGPASVLRVPQHPWLPEKAGLGPRSLHQLSSPFGASVSPCPSTAPPSRENAAFLVARGTEIPCQVPSLCTSPERGLGN